MLGMDEQPVELVKDTRVPIAATKEHPRRVDYKYERASVANVFMCTKPLSGWREVMFREKKTKADWAITMADLLDGRYADCSKVIGVCDNLNTHTIGAVYEVCEPERARSLVRRMEFHYTPKHGSWLYIAENELSSMARQYVAGRRIGDIAMLEIRDASMGMQRQRHDTTRHDTGRGGAGRRLANEN